MNHGLDYRSGMLQSWNKFCFTTGYVEVSVTLPGPDEDTTGYVSFFFFFSFLFFFLDDRHFCDGMSEDRRRRNEVFNFI